MNAERTLVQASAATRSWLQNLRDRLPHFEYREAGYYATFRSKSIRRALVHLNPVKRSIRLFLPLGPGEAPHLRPTPSTYNWAERFPSVFQITGEDDLPEAASLITKSYASVMERETRKKR